MSLWLKAIGAIACLAALAVWLFVFGGADAIIYGKNYVEKRRVIWQADIAKEIPVGSTKAQIQEWAENRSFKIVELKNSMSLEIPVEAIPFHQLACREWKIVAEITMKADKSTDNRVVSMGACR